MSVSEYAARRLDPLTRRPRCRWRESESQWESVNNQPADIFQRLFIQWQESLNVTEYASAMASDLKARSLLLRFTLLLDRQWSRLGRIGKVGKPVSSVSGGVSGKIQISSQYCYNACHTFFVSYMSDIWQLKHQDVSSECFQVLLRVGISEPFYASSVRAKCMVWHDSHNVWLAGCNFAWRGKGGGWLYALALEETPS